MAILSLIVPGAGQFYLKDRGRSVVILLAALVQGYLIYWGLDNFKIAQVITGSFQTSWLLILFALFWGWNIYDAYRLAQGKRGSNLIGILIPLIVVYIIAWQVTDVRFDRLVTRFGNALKIGNDILHPDLVTRNDSGAWAPSENFYYIFGNIVSGWHRPGQRFRRLKRAKSSRRLRSA